MKPEPKTTGTFRISPSDQIRLRRLAHLEGKKPTVIIRELVERWVDQREIELQKSA
ncbi:MAG: hypothetical protein ACKO7W_11480 [Elainella sp.]